MKDPAEKLRIKEWLKAQNIKRADLAEECGVSLITLNAWLSTKNMPDPQWKIIQKKMEETGKGTLYLSVKSLSVELSGTVLQVLEKRAEEIGMSVKEYILATLRYLSENPEKKEKLLQYIKEGKKESSPAGEKKTLRRAAEPPPDEYDPSGK